VTHAFDGPLRYGASIRFDTLQPHAADMLEHDRAVVRQMLSEPDRSPLGPAEQSGKPPLALDQRQVAQVSPYCVTPDTRMGSAGRHVVKTNTVLVHCHSLPSAATDVGWGAAIAINRTAAPASVKVAMTRARALRIHIGPSIVVAPFRDCAENTSKPPLVL
jgi:hypothetical protein